MKSNGEPCRHSITDDRLRPRRNRTSSKRPSVARVADTNTKRLVRASSALSIASEMKCGVSVKVTEIDVAAPRGSFTVNQLKAAVFGASDAACSSSRAALVAIRDRPNARSCSGPCIDASAMASKSFPRRSRFFTSVFRVVAKELDASSVSHASLRKASRFPRMASGVTRC